MFSSAQASVSLRPLPPIPMQAMFSLLLRFCPRKSVGTPNASIPAVRELVLMNSRRLIRVSKVVSGVFNVSTFGMVSTHATEYTPPSHQCVMMKGILKSNSVIGKGGKPAFWLFVVGCQRWYCSLEQLGQGLRDHLNKPLSCRR